MSIVSEIRDWFRIRKARAQGIVLVIDTPEGKLFKQIATGKCPDCGLEGFYEGPSGGASTNIVCTNEETPHWFNVTPMFGEGIAERIKR